MRLRRGGRNKETAVDSAPAAPIGGAGLPDEPRPIQPPPSGSVLGLSSAVGGPPEGPTDEWGFYDPDLAGVGALLSTLDTTAISFANQIDEDPGELLLRQEVRAATEPIEAFPSAFQGDDCESPRVSPAATAVASCRVPHLSPLSLWARVTDVEPCEELPRGPGRISELLAQRTPRSAFRNGTRLASSDLAAEIGRLMHPALVAMTGLSPACRIRGIRTEQAVAEPETDGDGARWPVPEVVAAPAAAVTATWEEPAAQPEVPAVADEPSVSLDLTAPDPPAAVEPLVEIELAEEPGIIVEAPALEALPTEFMPETLAAEGAPLEPACEPAQVLQAASDACSVTPPVVEETPCSIPVVPQAAMQDPPAQAAAAPVRRRRRTALALG